MTDYSLLTLDMLSRSEGIETGISTEGISTSVSLGLWICFPVRRELKRRDVANENLFTVIFGYAFPFVGNVIVVSFRLSVVS